LAKEPALLSFLPRVEAGEKERRIQGHRTKPRYSTETEGGKLFFTQGKGQFGSRDQSFPVAALGLSFPVPNGRIAECGAEGKSPIFIKHVMPGLGFGSK